MMKAVEIETVLPLDGKLPPSLSEAFGRKVRVILLYEDDVPNTTATDGRVSQLMELAGKIHAFQRVADPVDYQRGLRDEWTREWDE